MKKWMILSAACCLAVCLVSSTVAAGTDPPVLAPGETAIVRVYYPNQKLGNKAIISFEAQLLETNFDKGFHVMQVTREDIDRLTAAGLRVVLVDTWEAAEPEETETAAEETEEGGIPRYPCYRTVEETFATAEQIVKRHRKLARWVDVGDSWEKVVSDGEVGFDMKVLVLTNQEIGGEKPDLFVTAAMHAREYATAELVTRFAEYLVDNYGKDADVTWILDHHEIHLMLQTNPDGRKIAEDHTFWRKNTNATYCPEDFDSRGADLNRNFSFRWDCCEGSSNDECNALFHGATHRSEPEIQAVQSYMAEIFAVQRPYYDPEYDPDEIPPDFFDLDEPAPENASGIYIDVHSYGKLVLWPWGATPEEAPNATQLQTLGRKFAYWNDYSPEQAYGLYPTDGTSDGHAYGTFGVAAYCFEVGTTFFQTCKTFEAFVLPDNLPALLYAAKVVRTPYMTPAGPDAVDVTLDADQVPAGSLVTLTATIDDSRYKRISGGIEEQEPVQTILAAMYTIDVPPWEVDEGTPLLPVDGAFNDSAEVVEGVVNTADLRPGKHLVYVCGQDAGGNWGPPSAVFLRIVR